MSWFESIRNLFTLSPNRRTTDRSSDNDIIQSKSIVSNNNPVFLIITTPTCGACKNFKENYYNNLMNSMNKIDYIRTIHLDLNHKLMSASRFTGTKGELVPLCSKFLSNRVPCFFIINGADWNEAITEANISNPAFKMQHIKFEGSYSADELYKWALSNGKTMSISNNQVVENTLSNNSLNMKGVPYNPNTATIVSPKRVYESPFTNNSSNNTNFNPIPVNPNINIVKPVLATPTAPTAPNYVNTKGVYQSNYSF